MEEIKIVGKKTFADKKKEERKELVKTLVTLAALAWVAVTVIQTMQTMVKIWIDLDETENKKIEIFKAENGLSSKAKAIKKMIEDI